MLNVTITESAQGYLAGLLEKQNCEGIGVRMFVSDPGTPKAETCIAYSRPGEHNEEDLVVEYEAFNAYFEQRSIPFLDEAKVDFAEDKFGGQLTIRAPNSRLPNVTDDSPIEDKVNYLLYNDINPGLASHGGVVSLSEMADGIAVLGVWWWLSGLLSGVANPERGSRENPNGKDSRAKRRAGCDGSYGYL